MNRWLASILVGIAAIWIWGALGTLGPRTVSSTVAVTLNEMSFAPNRIDARVGQAVTLQVTN